MGTIMNGKGGDDNDKVIAAEEWKIIHIPDKPPLAPHLQPTVDVFAAVIQPNYANTIVRKLNHIAPLENLRHVKRVRKKCLDGGMSELSVVLCLTSAYNNLLDGIPENVAELIKHYKFANMLHQQKKNGKNNANIGQHHFIHPRTISPASLDLVKRKHIHYLPS